MEGCQSVACCSCAPGIAWQAEQHEQHSPNAAWCQSRHVHNCALLQAALLLQMPLPPAWHKYTDTLLLDLGSQPWKALCDSLLIIAVFGTAVWIPCTARSYATVQCKGATYCLGTLWTQHVVLVWLFTAVAVTKWCSTSQGCWGIMQSSRGSNDPWMVTEVVQTTECVSIRYGPTDKQSIHDDTHDGLLQCVCVLCRDNAQIMCAYNQVAWMWQESTVHMPTCATYDCWNKAHLNMLQL